MALLQPAINTNPAPPKHRAPFAMVGNQALLTETGPVGGAPDLPETNNAYSDQISLYTVRSGDSLSSIAELFGVSPNTILWANNLKAGATIKKDQILVILPISGVKYTVQKGDTVQSIAKAFNGDADDIISYNNLSDNQKLTAGEEIIIPDGEIATVVSSPTKPPVKTVNPTSTSEPVTGDQTGANSPPYNDPGGYFRRPLDGGIRTQGIHGHNGVDWGSPVGTPIHASAAGTVLISKEGSWNGGYGNYVVISHNNGMQTLYAHMKSTAVEAGTHVEKGQIIGYIGLTGNTSGPHVHFEVRNGVRNPF